MKVAVSIPDPIFEAAEEMAKERNQPRSQLYADALENYITTLGAESITSRLNQVYAHESSALDEGLAAMQLKMLKDEAW